MTARIEDFLRLFYSKINNLLRNVQCHVTLDQSWKLSRRLGISLSGTGKEITRRPYAPGQHGPNSRKNYLEYGQQLQEKQKLRHMVE